MNFYYSILTIFVNFFDFFFFKLTTLASNIISAIFWLVGTSARRVLYNKIGSAPLSFRLSVSYLGIGSLVFFRNLHGIRGSYIVPCDSHNLNRGFGLFKKIASLVLSGISVKQKFLWFINIVCSANTACSAEIWFSNYSQKWLSANEFSVFNRQYFINRLISDFDFWLVDKHE